MLLYRCSLSESLTPYAEFHSSVLLYNWHLAKLYTSLKHCPSKPRFCGNTPACLLVHNNCLYCSPYPPPCFFRKGLVASISIWQDKATVVGTNGCLLLFESLLLSRCFLGPCFGLDQLVARLPFRSDHNVPPELVSTLCSITTQQNRVKLNHAKAYYYFSIQMGSFLLHTSPPLIAMHKLTPFPYLLF